MNAVGIDVSKGKSTVAVIQPFWVVIAEPFDVFHTDSGLKELTSFIKSLSKVSKLVQKGALQLQRVQGRTDPCICKNNCQHTSDD